MVSTLPVQLTTKSEPFLVPSFSQLIHFSVINKSGAEWAFGGVLSLR